MSSINFNPSNVNAEALQQILGQCQNGKLTMRISSEMITKDVNVTGFSAQDIIDTANGMGAAVSSTNTLAGSESVSESKFTLDLIYEPYAGQLSSTASCVKGGNLEGATSQFSSAISNMVKDGIPVDVNALVQAVLRESYVDTTADLQFYAEKVKYFNEAKKMTREYVQDMRDFKTGLSDHLQKSGYCLSDPPSDPDKLADFNSKVAEYCASARGPAPFAEAKPYEYTDYTVVREINTATVAEIAKNVTIDQKLENADKLINDTFGTTLPSQIKDNLEVALKSGDDTKLNAAYKDVASYIFYLADSACENGKFAGYGNYGSKNHMYDDFHHLNGTTTPSYEDFRHCMYDSNDSQNITSRGNLNPGDIDLINEAFGFIGDQKINRSTSGDKVVDHAMKEVNDAWRNQIQVGIKQNTSEIEADINNLDGDSKWVQMYPDVILEYTVEETKTGTMYVTDDKMAQDLGLPCSIPGDDIQTVDDLDNAISKFEEKLSTIGDDSQLANTDLQNVLQKQQQTLQMMSNISKMLSDTALAVIRKMG